MLKLKTYGEQLSAMLASRSMSASSLASALNLDSSTSISRLIRDMSGEKKQRELIDLICEHDGLFTQPEIDKLREGIEVSRLGKLAYKTQKSIETLIFGGEEDSDIIMEDGGTLSAMLKKLPDKEPLQVICINSVENNLLPALETLLEDQRRLVEINHYVCINEDTRNPAIVLHAASRVLFDKRYRLYLASTRDNGTDAYFFAPCMMLLKLGVSQYADEQVMIITSDRRARYVKNTGRSGMFDLVKSWIADMRPTPKLLDRAYEQEGDGSLLGLVFMQYKMEKRRALYQIKPDFCSGQFPTSVLGAVMPQSNESGDALPESTASSILSLFDARVSNIDEKKQPTYFVCSPVETQRFIDTGRLSDHPYCMRTYTVSERAEALKQFIGRAKNNPRYHFYFLNDGISIKRFQFICYEGLGVMVVKQDTDYQADHCKDSLYVTDDIFMKLYISFYTQTLLPRYCRTEEQSLHMLEYMLAKLQA